MYFVARMDLSCALDWHLDANNPISKIQAINKNCHFMFHLFSKKWLFYKCMNDMFHINFNIFAKSRLLIFLFGTLSDADSKQGSVWTSRLLGKQLTTLKDKKKKRKIYYIVYGLLCLDNRLMTQTKWVETGVSSTVRQQTCNIDGLSSAKYLQSVLIKASIL